MCGSANLSTILLPDRFADFTGPNDAHFLICLDAWKNLSISVPPDSQSMSHQRNWGCFHLMKLLTTRCSTYCGCSTTLGSFPTGYSNVDDRYTSGRQFLPHCSCNSDSVHRSVHHTSALMGPPSKVPGYMVSAVGNQAVGLPDIQQSMSSSNPPYRQLRFRQDSNHKVWFSAIDNKKPDGNSTMP